MKILRTDLAFGRSLVYPEALAGVQSGSTTIAVSHDKYILLLILNESNQSVTDCRYVGFEGIWRKVRVLGDSVDTWEVERDRGDC